MKILMVLTSHDRLGDTGHATGFWLEEFAAPYYVLSDAGAELTLASPKGEQPPVDPKSEADDAQTPATRRFGANAVFYPGGHGPLWDLAGDADSIALIEKALGTGKPVAAVCHAPAVLRHVKDSAARELVRGKRVTGFSNTEEAAVGPADVLPFSVEEMLRGNGGDYRCAEDWNSHAERDGLLITGQNPASSEATAQALLEVLWD